MEYLDIDEVKDLAKLIFVAMVQSGEYKDEPSMLILHSYKLAKRFVGTMRAFDYNELDKLCDVLEDVNNIRRRVADKTSGTHKSTNEITAEIQVQDRIVYLEHQLGWL